MFQFPIYNWFIYFPALLKHQQKHPLHLLKSLLQHLLLLMIPQAEEEANLMVGVSLGAFCWLLVFQPLVLSASNITKLEVVAMLALITTDFKNIGRGKKIVKSKRKIFKTKNRYIPIQAILLWFVKGRKKLHANYFLHYLISNKILHNQSNFLKSV